MIIRAVRECESANVRKYESTKRNRRDPAASAGALTRLVTSPPSPARGRGYKRREHLRAASVGAARDGGPPPSPALPHKLRGGGRTAETRRSGIEFSPLPRSGGGAGGGGPVGRSSLLFEAPPRTRLPGCG